MFVRIKSTRIFCLDSTSLVVEMSLRTSESVMFSWLFFSCGKKNLTFFRQRKNSDDKSTRLFFQEKKSITFFPGSC